MSETRQDWLDPTAFREQSGGSRIERHRHSDDQIIYPSSGAAEVRTDAGSWIAPADRAIWIPAGCWHEHTFFGPTRFHCVGFPSGSLPQHRTPVVITAQPLLRELLIACSDPGDLPAAELDRLRGVLLDRIARSPEQPLRLPAARDDRLRRACELVECDLAVSRPLADLGSEVGAGERTLTRLFRTEFAMTYPQWRTQLRLQHAIRLLADGEPVTAVAHRCGWASPSAFIDVYRRTLGHTPGTAIG
ncbi:AraC family transcriptional regulator [Nocardia sp. NPDC059240]|uniref:AraC family transcriptional regulator n=1 Tax=Nocardia sp. NPDC059240 TaxID=3346786 RepID=UPI003689D005